MISNIIKFIVSIFLLIVSVLLFALWLILGTILLTALIIRFISLYTIALLNSFVSGTPLIHDYTKAIEDIINMYLDTFAKILSMPKLPWQNDYNKDSTNLRALLPTEIAELKKSWAITLVVFASYIISFGFCLAIISQSGKDKQKNEYEIELKKLEGNYNQLVNEIHTYKIIISEFEKNNVNAVRILYSNKNYSINSISEFLNLTPEKIREIINENNIIKK